MTWRVIVSDCVEAMKAMPDESIDAICTDPPFNWSFMGRTFDSIGSPREYQAWTERWATEAIRLLKPGGYAFVCGGDRTQHRQVAGLEDAGFKPKTIVVHIHGQGFPKNRSLGNGTGTALKPAAEFWALLQKPFKGTYSDCVARYGTGGLNVDGCRVGFVNETPNLDAKQRRNNIGGGGYEPGVSGKTIPTDIPTYKPEGRWPPNLLLSHIPPDANGDFGCVPRGTKRVKGSGAFPRQWSASATFGQVVAGERPERIEIADADGTEECESWECAEGCPVKALDDQAGERKGSTTYVRLTDPHNAVFGAELRKAGTVHQGYADNGGPSRFFPCFSVEQGNFIMYNDSKEDAPCGERLLVDESTSAGKKTASNGEDLRTDGYGSKPTDPSLTDTKYTTSTSTRLTMNCQTSNASPANGTTSTTHDSERITEPSMASRNGDASDATYTDRSINSADEPQAPITATASLASPSTNGNGRQRIPATTTKSTADGETRIQKSRQPSNDGTSSATGRSASLTSANTGSAKRQSGSSNPLNDVFPNFSPDALPADADGLVPFRYVAKSSRRERGCGLPEGMTNTNPCVKPVALLRWLTRLVCVRGGTLLDPFMGSGSGGIAALLECVNYIGIEQNPTDVETARHRIAHVERHGEDWLKAAGKAKLRERDGGTYGGGKGIVYKVPRCPEHDVSFRSGTGLYICGCPFVHRPATENPRFAESAADLERTPEDVAHAESYDDLPLFALASDD